MAAWGLVHPFREGQLVHTCPLRDGFAKVTIDNVLDGFNEIALPVPPNDEMTTLIHAKASFTQWPKKDILLAAKPASAVHLSPTTVLTPKIKEAPFQAPHSDTEETMSTPARVTAKTGLFVDMQEAPSKKIPETPPPPVEAKPDTPASVPKAKETEETTPTSSVAAKTSVRAVDMPTGTTVLSSEAPTIAESQPAAVKAILHVAPAVKMLSDAPAAKTAETVPAAVQASSSVPNKESTIPRNVAAAMMSLVGKPPQPATRVTRSNKLIAKTVDAPQLPPAAKSKAAGNGSKPATTAAVNGRRHGNSKKSKNEQPIDMASMDTQQLQAAFNAGDVPISEIQPKYQPGGPLIHNVKSISSQLGIACDSLEKYYRANFKKPQSERLDGFFISFKPEVFHHGGLPFFDLCWEELYHMLNLKEVGASMMMCQLL